MASPFKLGIVVACVVMAAAVVAAIASAGIRSGTPQQIGPSVAPFAVAILLAALAALLLLQAAIGQWKCEAAADDPVARCPASTFAWLAAGVTANVVLIGPLGFIPASSLLFAATARALGSRTLTRNLALGAALAAAIEFAFVRLLGLDLGAGMFSLSA